MSNSTWRFVPPARDVASEGGPSGEPCLFRGKTNRLDIKIELDLAKQSHQGNIVLVRCELVTWVGFITLNAKKLNQIRTNVQGNFILSLINIKTISRKNIPWKQIIPV